MSTYPRVQIFCPELEHWQHKNEALEEGSGRDASMLGLDWDMCCRTEDGCGMCSQDTREPAVRSQTHVGGAPGPLKARYHNLRPRWPPSPKLGETRSAEGSERHAHGNAIGDERAVLALASDAAGSAEQGEREFFEALLRDREREREYIRQLAAESSAATAGEGGVHGADGEAGSGQPEEHTLRRLEELGATSSTATLF